MLNAMNFYTPQPVGSQKWECCPAYTSGCHSDLPFDLIQLFFIVHAKFVPMTILLRPACLFCWYLKSTIPPLNICHNLFTPFPISRFCPRPPPVPYDGALTHRPPEAGASQPSVRFWAFLPALSPRGT